jgi:hypothetical protein
MRIAAVSSAAQFSLAIPFALALSLFALARPAVAQDATKTESATPAARQSDSSSDRQHRRAERRQAEASSKTESGAKPEDLAKFPKADTTATANTAPAKPKMECRKQEVTGSRLGKNVCATPEQWAEADAAGEAAAKELRNQQNSKGGAARDMGPYRGGSTL